MNGGLMDMWARIDDPQAWGYFKRQDIPYHYALADAYTVGDAYHVHAPIPALQGQQVNDVYRPALHRTQTQTGGFGRYVGSFMFFQHKIYYHRGEWIRTRKRSGTFYSSIIFSILIAMALLNQPVT
jgi:hypothetical protein